MAGGSPKCYCVGNVEGRQCNIGVDKCRYVHGVMPNSHIGVHKSVLRGLYLAIEKAAKDAGKNVSDFVDFQIPDACYVPYETMSAHSRPNSAKNRNNKYIATSNQSSREGSRIGSCEGSREGSPETIADNKSTGPRIFNGRTNDSRDNSPNPSSRNPSNGWRRDNSSPADHKQANGEISFDALRQYSQINPPAYNDHLPMLPVARPDQTFSNFKTTECRYWREGSCTRGDKCKFLHNISGNNTTKTTAF